MLGHTGLCHQPTYGWQLAKDHSSTLHLEVVRSHDPCIGWKIWPVSAIAWPMMDKPPWTGSWLLWSHLSRYPVIFLGWMTLVTILPQLPWLHQVGYPAYILSPKVLGTLVTCVHWSTLSQPLLIPSWTMVNDSYSSCPYWSGENAGKWLIFQVVTIVLPRTLLMVPIYPIAVDINQSRNIVGDVNYPIIPCWQAVACV